MIKKLEGQKLIDKNEIVRVKETGNILELMNMEKWNCKQTIRKINAEWYEIISTGEVREIQHIENRSEDMKSIRRSLGNLRDLLNTNIIDPKNCRWLTRTYAENMKDPRRLYDDSKDFHRRLRKVYGNYEYITVAEPQGRGAWHTHDILIFEGQAPYISNEEMKLAWRQGFVTVKRLDDVDNVGAYLTAYLGDMEIQEAVETLGIHEINTGKFQIKEIETFDDGGKPLKKAFLKGARLHMYPPKFNLYRYSRGIKKPSIVRMTEGAAEEKAKGATLTFEKTVLITDPSTDYENTINYRYYNKARKKSNP